MDVDKTGCVAVVFTHDFDFPPKSSQDPLMGIFFEMSCKIDSEVDWHHPYVFTIKLTRYLFLRRTTFS